MVIDKKRILIMVNNLTGGGAERVAATQLRLIANCGEYEVAVATCTPNLLDDIEYQKYMFKNFLSTPVYKFIGTLGLGFNAIEMKDCLSSFKPDIIHIHAFIHFSSSALEVLQRYKQESNCKVILTHHTFSYICPNDSFFNYKAKQVCEQCLSRTKRSIIYNNCYDNICGSVAKYIQKQKFYRLFKQNFIDAHIAPSDFLKEKLLCAFPHMHVQVIHNPCLKNIEYKAVMKHPGKMVYFGRISREKNLASIVKAMEYLKGERFHLVIIGTGPDANNLERMIKSSPVKKQIHFINNFLTEKELYPLIADAQYYVLPSLWYENSPVAIIEALNLEIIPIVSNLGGMKELLDLIEIGYGFNPEDPSTIIQALLKAEKNNESDIIKLKDTKAQKLLPFTWNEYLQELVALYEQVYITNTSGEKL